MSRLDRLGKGMLLLHDNHQWTADMVPMLLRELKAKGYRVVHMVPGPGTRPDRRRRRQGLVLGDRAGDRRLEAAARKGRRADERTADSDQAAPARVEQIAIPSNRPCGRGR